MKPCAACWKKPCECASYNGVRQPYDDHCDHEFDEDEDAGEYVCNRCGEREPIPLDRIIRE